ncbi:MAG: PilN domain-containing protein [Candidatus Paceibacterota bacterium]|jgi:hypothetical protein
MNLLPQKEKIENQKDYLCRFLAGLVGVIIVSLMIGGFALFPSYILIQARQTELKVELDSLNNSQSTSGSEEIYQLLETANRRVDFLSIHQGLSLTAAVKEISAYQPVGVIITSLAYHPQENASGRLVAVVSLKGVASNREVIVDFVKNLQTEPTFTGINVPVSSFAKDRDIEFSLTFVQNEE